MLAEAQRSGGQIARAKLWAVESAWITYRDAVCEYVASSGEGANGPAAHGKALEDCLIAKTKAHIEELRQLPRP